MRPLRTRNLCAATLICTLALGTTAAHAADPSTPLGAVALPAQPVELKAGYFF